MYYCEGKETFNTYNIFNTFNIYKSTTVKVRRLLIQIFFVLDFLWGELKSTLYVQLLKKPKSHDVLLDTLYK